MFPEMHCGTGDSLAVVGSFLFFSCVRHAPVSDTACMQSRKELDSLRNEYRNYNVNGLYDSIIVTARPYLLNGISSHDTLAVLYSGAYMAQAFLTLEEMDSVRSCMNLISPFRAGGRTDPSLQTVLYIVGGLLHLKSELNYSLAMESFRRGCEWAELGDDPDNHIVLLANMAHIFYVRKDRHGLEYAQKAYEISKRPDVAEFPRCEASLLIGQMLLLSGQPGAAAKHLDAAKEMTGRGKIKSLESICDLLYANMFREQGNWHKADSCFKEAIESSHDTAAGTAVNIYLDYGQFCQERGLYDRALDLYMTGLDISRAHRSMEFRSELLSRISDIYRCAGDRASAAEYSYLYKSFTDSIANLQKEQEFNNRLMYYSQIEHDHEIQTKELALLRARRKSTTALSVSATIVILALLFYVMYMKQRKMNRTLVRQYENYMQRTLDAEHEKTSGKKEKGNAADRELFARIESMMKQDRVYRQKDLSLDKLAEMLSTNRVYVSKAINSCSSLSFFSYVDQYRIREAVSILSSDRDENAPVPFKQIADIVGYNSVQVFYRSFKRETGCSPGHYKEEARIIRKQRESAED